MHGDKACFVTVWRDVKSHGKLNLLDVCLSKPMHSGSRSAIPVRDDFHLTGIVSQVHLWELQPQLFVF